MERPVPLITQLCTFHMLVRATAAEKWCLLQLRKDNCAAECSGDISSLGLLSICDKVMTGRPAQGEALCSGPPLNSDIAHNELDPAACADWGRGVGGEDGGYKHVDGNCCLFSLELCQSNQLL